MLTPNMHYSELKDSYLFNTIYRKTAEYQSSHPDKKIYRMGVGGCLTSFVQCGY